MARPAKQNTVEPKRIMKGNRIVVSDQFKLEPAKMKKNTSYRMYDPKIKQVEHAHWFRTFDSKGKKHTTSAKCGGHFHKMTVKMDKEGNLSAECGIPMREVLKRIRPGVYKKVIEEVKYFTMEDESEFIQDKHTHKTEYYASDDLSDEKRATVHKADASKLQQLRAAMPAAFKETDNNQPNKEMEIQAIKASGVSVNEQ